MRTLIITFILLALLALWYVGTAHTDALKVAVISTILVKPEAVLVLHYYSWWYKVVEKYWRQPELLYFGGRFRQIDPVRIRGPS